MRIALMLALLLLPASPVFGDDEVVINKLGGDIDVREAPAGATLRTLGGDIRLRRANRDVFAKTMGGDIRIDSLEGSLRARTLGGEIRVHAVGTGSGRKLYLHSIGGDVELTVPRNFPADFEIEIDQKRHGDHYHVDSDVPLETKEWRTWSLFGGSRRIVSAKGTNGRAANHVIVETVGGNVRIRYE
jgi:DUF4097 and DUF4098 domain-containing protein YvlB